MSVGQFQLQQALFTKLNSDNTLTDTLGAAVHDDVPASITYPFMVVSIQS